MTGNTGPNEPPIASAPAPLPPDTDWLCGTLYAGLLLCHRGADHDGPHETTIIWNTQPGSPATKLSPHSESTTDEHTPGKP